MTVRTSEAQWDGNLQDGKGRFWTGSGEVSGDFSFSTRFEEQPGTNPEELIGAALAGCYSMALSADLERAGYRPESVRTKANVIFEKGEAGWTVERIELESEASVPGIADEEFQTIAAGTKEGCPVSRTLASPIELKAHLVG
jgi:osmotically inducible protein OsmC